MPYIGITAIEMAEKKPPHADLHPMRVLFVIPKAEQPLLKGQHVSAHFKDFVSQCTIRDPLKRPSAVDLLKHPFLKVWPRFYFSFSTARFLTASTCTNHMHGTIVVYVSNVIDVT